MDEVKFFKGVTEDNIRKKIEELKKDNYSVDNIFIKDLEDEFILICTKKPKSMPPESDLQKDIHTDIPPYQGMYNTGLPNQNGILQFAKQHWYFSAPIVLGIGYYFLIYLR